MRPLIYQSNPLAFPGGAPGFDPTHPAAVGTIVSLITSGGTFINLINGEAVTSTVGSPLLAMDGLIGPSVNDAASLELNYAIASPTSATSVNAAAIVRTSSSIGNPGYIFTTQGTLANNIGLGTRSGEWSFQVNASFAEISAPVPATNTAYFIAFSNYNSMMNWVIVNLYTGQTWSGSLSLGAMSTQSDTTLYMFHNTLGKPWLGLCATFMLAYNNPLSPSKLNQWAQRPWDFWYPSTAAQLLFRPLRAPLLTKRGYVQGRILA